MNPTIIFFLFTAYSLVNLHPLVNLLFSCLNLCFTFVKNTPVVYDTLQLQKKKKRERHTALQHHATSFKEIIKTNWSLLSPQNNSLILKFICDDVSVMSTQAHLHFPIFNLPANFPSDSTCWVTAKIKVILTQ